MCQIISSLDAILFYYHCFKVIKFEAIFFPSMMIIWIALLQYVYGITVVSLSAIRLWVHPRRKRLTPKSPKHWHLLETSLTKLMSYSCSLIDWLYLKFYKCNNQSPSHRTSERYVRLTFSYHLIASNMPNDNTNLCEGIHFNSNVYRFLSTQTHSFIFSLLDAAF